MLAMMCRTVLPSRVSKINVNIETCMDEQVGLLRLRVSEKRVLGKIVGPKWYEVTGVRIKLHDELHNNIIRSIKSNRMMRQAGKYRAWKK
jgi:hypothetical protein